MKVCDVTQFFSPVGGGVRRYIQEKRRYVLNQTDDEHLLVVPGERTETLREGRLTTCTIASPPINRTSRYRILFNLRQASEFILREHPDVIESGDPYHLAWRAIDLGEELRAPVFGFYHSHFPEAYLRTIFKYCGPWLRDVGMAYAQDYIVRLYNTFDYTLVPSEYLAELLEEWGVFNTRHVHLGIDTATFHPQGGGESASLRASMGISTERKLLLYIGRLAGEKNTKTLIQAFRLLEREHPGRYSFLIVGDGQLRRHVAQFQEEIRHAHWIAYCNESEKLAEYYRMADVFVHPGVCETFGLVSLESQACGTPVVGIHGSYMDANIFSGLHLWADRNTPGALAGAINRMTEADSCRIGEDASHLVRERYSWERVFGNLWECYREGLRVRRELPVF